MTTCDPGVPVRAVGDPLRLGQVITNLCSNAVKFTDVGEVEVRVSLEASGAPGPATGDLLRVEVRDTGIGIDLDGRPESLFEAFTQADGSSTRRHDGTGLGLAICHRLVEAMGGRIGVSSAPGQGSTFWFTAPVGDAEHAATSVRGNHRLRGARVLVVDDNATARSALVGHLRAWAAEPHTCAGVAEARDELARAEDVAAPYDLVLVDCSLPEGTALALAEEVAAGSDGPSLVLLDSTSPDQHDNEQGTELAARFHATAAKPVRRDDLWQALVVAQDRGTTTGLRRTPGAVPSGVRVLLAEDNTVNQMVAVGLLESLGCTVDVAVDGEQALARLTPGHPYHVVLMDYRMPRTDGIEATGRLRAQESARPPGERVPVLAMTASVLGHERERCLEAGMDEFLTKPVSRAGLSRALARWVRLYRLRSADPDLPLSAAAAVDPVLTTDPNLLYPDEDERPVLDFERVEMLRELVKDGLTFFDRTRESYLSRVDGQLTQLAAAAARQDHGSVDGLAHQLRGSSANLGLVRVADGARAVEEAAREGRSGLLPGLLAELADLVAQGRRALDSVGRTAESRPGPAPRLRPEDGLRDST